MRDSSIDTAAEVATKVARAGGTSAIEASFITFGLHSPYLAEVFLRAAASFFCAVGYLSPYG
jgi:hypothetical protein